MTRQVAGAREREPTDVADEHTRRRVRLLEDFLARAFPYGESWGKYSASKRNEGHPGIG